MTLFGGNDASEFDGPITEFDGQCQGIGAQQAGESGTEGGLKRWYRTTTRVLAVCAVATTVLALSACGHKNAKTYDIAPIFPLSSDKCQKYDGKTEGSGIAARCWVTKSECEQAASDWRQAMRTGGVTDAIEFKC